jgi:imidazole glycerol phosphate synthase subunit HisF
MLKKRISAVLVVKNGLVVQSFGFSTHLPIGKITQSVRNLANWKVDEIIILDISAAARGQVDLDLIKAASAASAGTPLIYGGGIHNAQVANKVIRNGADRLVIGASLIDGTCSPQSIAEATGAQAVILSLPLIQNVEGLFVFNYNSGTSCKIDAYQDLYLNQSVSEVLLTDVTSVGRLDQGFSLLDACKTQFKGVSQILYGGIAATDITSLLGNNDVASVAIGNKLQHQELSYWHVKQSLTPQHDNFPRKINAL